MFLCDFLQVTWRRANPSVILTVGLYTYFGDSRFQTQNVLHKDQWNLHIRNVSLDDQGRYECQVSTKARDIRRRFYLNVKGLCCCCCCYCCCSFCCFVLFVVVLFVMQNDTLQLSINMQKLMIFNFLYIFFIIKFYLLIIHLFMSRFSFHNNVLFVELLTCIR